MGRGGVNSIEIENTKLLLHASCGKEISRVRRECDGANDVIMLKGVGYFAGMGVPYFAANELAKVAASEQLAYAVKSAEAVAAY